MAKHKKIAPAAKKKPAAKPTKPVKPTKPAVKPKAQPKAAPKVKPSAKPQAQPKAQPKAKPQATPAAKPKAKSQPIVSSKAASKKNPPVPVKKTDASSKQPAKGKTNPPIPAKAPSTGKTTPPVSVPAKKIAAPAAPAAKSRPPIPAPAPTSKPAAPVAAKAAPEVKTSVPRAVPPVDKAAAKASARDLLRTRILGAKKANKPIAFSLDEIREIAKTSTPAKDVSSSDEKPATKSSTVAKPAKIDLSKLDKPSQPHHIKAASLADILGFNPRKAQKPTTEIDPETIPEKFRRYYKLLLDLRHHLTAGIELHSEETLKRSSKDDSGDLSGYGQHMADSGTDTFDRDFALSLVSSEQEALTEIEAAIKRILDGSYGICEATQKPIAKDRLLAVPFTRYSAEAQKDIERNRMRTRSSAGLFGEMGEEGGKIPSDGGGDDE